MCLQFPSDRSAASSPHSLRVLRSSCPTASAGVDLLSLPWSQEPLSLLVLCLSHGPFSNPSSSPNLLILASLPQFSLNSFFFQGLVSDWVFAEPLLLLLGFLRESNPLRSLKTCFKVFSSLPSSGLRYLPTFYFRLKQPHFPQGADPCPLGLSVTSSPFTQA